MTIWAVPAPVLGGKHWLKYSLFTDVLGCGLWAMTTSVARETIVISKDERSLMLSRALTSVPRRPLGGLNPAEDPLIEAEKFSKQPEPAQVVTMELDSLGLKSLDKPVRS